MTITGAGRTYCTRGAGAGVGAAAEAGAVACVAAGPNAGTSGSFGGRFASARRSAAACVFSRRLRRCSCAVCDCVLTAFACVPEPRGVDGGDGADGGCEAEEDGDDECVFAGHVVPPWESPFTVRAGRPSPGQARVKLRQITVRARLTRPRVRMSAAVPRLASVARGFAGAEPPAAWPRLRGTPRPERAEQAVSTLQGVGPAQEKKLAKLGLRTVRDLLEHRPHRYEAAVPERRIADLLAEEEAAIAGEVRSVSVRRAAAQPGDRQRASRRRERRDRGRLVQPGVARGEAAARNARAPARPAEAQRLPGSLVRPERRRRDGRLRPGLPGQRGGDAAAAARARRAGSAARRATCPTRCRPS